MCSRHVNACLLNIHIQSWLFISAYYAYSYQMFLSFFLYLFIALLITLHIVHVHGSSFVLSAKKSLIIWLLRVKIDRVMIYQNRT